MLIGFEPDFQWQRFTAAVLQLVQRYEVSFDHLGARDSRCPCRTPVPIGVTVSGNRAELIEGDVDLAPRTQAPANALHLLEFRLQELGHPTAGFVLLIPHYLADTEYPAAAVAALESVSAATGLIFPTDRLREESRDFLARIDEPGRRATGSSPSSSARSRSGTTPIWRRTRCRSPLTDDDGELPTADEIAAELQEFLANRRQDDAS